MSQKTAEELNFKNENWLQMVDQLKTFSNFVPLDAVAFMRRMNDLKEQPLPSVPEVDEMVTEPDTEGFPHDHLDHKLEQLDSELEPSSSNINNAFFEENSLETRIKWEMFDYSCLKVMDRNLGAPPSTYLVGKAKEKIKVT